MIINDVTYFALARNDTALVSMTLRARLKTLRLHNYFTFASTLQANCFTLVQRLQVTYFTLHFAVTLFTPFLIALISLSVTNFVLQDAPMRAITFIQI